jgi:SHS family lactate transporter-like MFS transporter
VLSYFAVERGMGFALPMMVGTILSLILVIVFILMGPETKGKELTADLQTLKPAE